MSLKCLLLTYEVPRGAQKSSSIPSGGANSAVPVQQLSDAGLLVVLELVKVECEEASSQWLL